MPAVDDPALAAAESLIERAAQVFEACETLTVRAEYYWKTTGVVAGGEATLDVRAVMAEGGKFGVTIQRGDDEIAGLCCDGSELIEWNRATQRWTRYPVAQRGRLRHLTTNVAGKPPVATALWQFAASWVDGRSPFGQDLRSSLPRAERITIGNKVIADRACSTVELRESRRDGAMQAKGEALLALADETGLPVVEETRVRMTGLLIPLGSQTHRIDYRELTLNAPLGADAFTFTPPSGWEFVPAESLKFAAERLLGQSAAQWEFQSLAGDTVSISELCSRKPVLLVAWATWCAPCKVELAELRKLYESPEFAQRVEVLAVSMDERADAVQGFLNRSPLPFLVAHDPESLHRHGFSSVPTTLLIDRQGRVAQSWQSWNEYSDAEREFSAALDALEAGG